MIKVFGAALFGAFVTWFLVMAWDEADKMKAQREWQKQKMEQRYKRELGRREGVAEEWQRFRECVASGERTSHCLEN